MLPRDSEILARLREKGLRILSFRELMQKLGVSEAEEEAFREQLDSLERRGQIVRVRGEKYSAIEFTNQVAGRITVRPEGFGFVLVEGGPDLFIPRSGMHGAMDGDTVLAREERPRSRGRSESADRISGTVVRVLDRARERVVGRFEKHDGRATRSPRTTRGSTRSCESRTARPSGAREGEIVEARLTAFPDARRIAHGVVEERLGFLGEPGVDIEIVLRSHGLPPRFPQPVVEEAERYPHEVSTEDLLGRTRLPGPSDRHDRRRDRARTSTTRSRSSDGPRLPARRPHRRRLALRPGGNGLDDEARSRGTQRVLPGPRPANASGETVERPLLPESRRGPTGPLRDPRDGRKGRVVSSEFVKGVIRSAERMTYTEVARLLETRPTAGDEERYGPLLGDFREMAELAAMLRERREARGSIDFDLPDADVVLDDAGLVVGIVPESRNVAHRLIEEFMLAANEAVAKKLLFAKQPAIYRVHDRPDPDRLVDLREVLAELRIRAEGRPGGGAARPRSRRS